jgi:hypothetical protein
MTHLKGAHEADADRDLWIRVIADYADEHAFQARDTDEPTWASLTSQK